MVVKTTNLYVFESVNQNKIKLLFVRLQDDLLLIQNRLVNWFLLEHIPDILLNNLCIQNHVDSEEHRHVMLWNHLKFSYSFNFM